MSLKLVRQLFSLVASAAVLAGCGGGGGDPPAPTPPPGTTYTIGGTVSGLASGATVVLRLNGATNASVTANGAFTFSTPFSSGATYAVTVLTQPATPAQTCTVASGSGTVAAANITNVAVTCVANTAAFFVGGTVAGLASGTSVVLQVNGGNNLTVSANGPFTFSSQLNTGTAYAVTVLTQPAAQTCTVAAGSGTVTAAVTNVAVTCAANTYTVGGTVSGLATGGTVVLQNNAGNDLTVSANGPFTFTTPVVTGGAYAVTVLTNPTVPGPGQVCTPTAATGTVAMAAVTTVVITCANIDQTALTITTRNPLETAVGAKIQGGVVTVTFSEAVNPATVTNSTFSVAGPSGAVAGAISFATGNTQAIFTPTANLSFDESYTVTVSTGVQDPSGNGLATASAWSFNTGKKVAFGFLHTCARMDDGRVKCWGDNTFGQLGYDDTNDRGDAGGEMGTALAAVNLGTGRTAISLAAGDFHTCAILDDGTSKCWGRNYDTTNGTSQGGALGQGVTGPASQIGDAAGEMAALLPINLGSGRTAKEIVAGQDSTCARLDNDTVKCWGINVYGQLGQGNTAPLGIAAGDIAAALPIDFGTGLTPVSITVGHHSGCAILTNGSGGKVVKCWGRSNWGQLGQGSTASLGDGAGEMGALLPTVDLGTGLTPEVVLSNGGHNCALLANGSGGRVVKCWGLNTWGQLGLDAGISLAGNAAFNLRLQCTGGVNDCIGDQASEMGDSLPAVPGIGSNVSRLTVGYRHTCVRTTSNTQLVCWGSNQEGQLGLLAGNSGNDVIIGDQNGEANSLVASALTGAVIEEATVGGFHSCVWNANDTLNCWGWNSNAAPFSGGGQLGHGNTSTFGNDVGEMLTLPNTDLGT